MKGSVSNRRASVLTLAVSMSVVWLVFILNGFPGSGLLWVSLVAFTAFFWVARGSTRSMANVIDDIEAEPVQAFATPVRRRSPLVERRDAR
jgi:hypothetical protein